MTSARAPAAPSTAAESPNDASMTTTEAPVPVPATRADRLLAQFTSFRSELDAHQAQRERIVKLSRDVTALSKQLIFALHRVGTGRTMESVFREAEGKFKDLRGLFEKLQGEIRAERFTFFYYLQHHSLPTLEEAQASLLPPPPAVPTPLPVSAETAAAVSSDTTISTGAPTSDAESSTAQLAEQELAGAAAAPAYYVHVTVYDYLGGVADLTGELMRLAIASVGKNLHASLSAPATTAAATGGRTGENDNGGADFANIDRIGKLVREIKGQMDPLAVHARWLPKKLTVLDQSLAKIENASYNLRIRGAEYKDSPAMLQALARKMAESGGGGGGGGADRRGGDEIEASA
ncbi:hypothetical protein B0A53_01006 [Rhodotorula sp. CCFEE 5036]|nr:hypothetical protein B0A53_01006 [Rhodotorula sp. CCFEE 5036]